MSNDASSPGEVEILDTDGTDLGFCISVGPSSDENEDDDPTGTKALAARITGWSTLHLDGEPYTYSKERALALLIRFPHFAAQIAAAPGATA